MLSMCAFTHVHANTYMCVYVVCVHLYVYSCVYVVCVCLYVSACMAVCARVCMHVHTLHTIHSKSENNVYVLLKAHVRLPQHY